MDPVDYRLKSLRKRRHKLNQDIHKRVDRDTKQHDLLQRQIKPLEQHKKTAPATHSTPKTPKVSKERKMKSIASLIRPAVSSAYSRTRVAANVLNSMKAAGILRALGIQAEMADSSEDEIVFRVKRVTVVRKMGVEMPKDLFRSVYDQLAGQYGEDVRNDSSRQTLVKKITWRSPVGNGRIILLQAGHGDITITFLNR